MDENIRQRLNNKLQKTNLCQQSQLSQSPQTNLSCSSCSSNIEQLSELDSNQSLKNDFLYLQDEYIPQRNFSVLEEVVTDTNKLALVILFGVALYALYVLSKKKD